MSKSQDVPEDDIADKGGWFSRRPFPVFIIAAWPLIPLFNIQWSAVIQYLKTGELAIFQFILILLHPLLLLLAGISLLLLKRNSVYLFIASFVFGIFKLLQSGIIAPFNLVPFNLLIIFGTIIYFMRLLRTGVLK